MLRELRIWVLGIHRFKHQNREEKRGAGMMVGLLGWRIIGRKRKERDKRGKRGIEIEVGKVIGGRGSGRGRRRGKGGGEIGRGL